jgi:RimJ/RimL family protein N-acetyltransferase
VSDRLRLERGSVLLRPLRTQDTEKVLGSLMPWVTDGAPARDVRENLRSRIASSGTMTERELLLGIDVGGRLVGDVQARRDGGPKGVFELGITVFDQADRGKGIGRDAISALTAHLFAMEGAHRVQLTTDVANGAMRAVVDRLGFGFEGVLRGFWPEPDGCHDYAMYAMTKDDYESVSRAWT